MIATHTLDPDKKRMFLIFWDNDLKKVSRENILKKETLNYFPKKQTNEISRDTSENESHRTKE